VHKLTLGELTIIRVQRHIILGKACSLLWIIHRHWVISRLLLHIVARNKLVVILG
jgi:hypothetical protein